MSNPTKRVGTAEREAADWHARLSTTSVATQTIEEFFAWRALPGNADAYARVERVWTEGPGLAADPEVAAALRAARSAGPGAKGARRRSILYAGVTAMAAAVAIAGGGVWWSSRGIIETEVGELQVVQLADGSTVSLDTDSRMRVRFVDGERQVELLRGQALFDVAKDASRPFVVTADGARVVAVGTVFDVRHDAEGVRVTLVSGLVDVSGEGGEGARRMQPGQRAEITRAGLTTATVDVSAATSWASGRLVFDDVPLAEAVDEMNRYLTRRIVIEDPSLRTIAVNGVLKAGDRDALIAAASETLDLVVSQKPDGSVGLSRPRG